MESGDLVIKDNEPNLQIQIQNEQNNENNVHKNKDEHKKEEEKKEDDNNEICHVLIRKESITSENVGILQCSEDNTDIHTKQKLNESNTQTADDSTITGSNQFEKDKVDSITDLNTNISSIGITSNDSNLSIINNLSDNNINSNVTLSNLIQSIDNNNSNNTDNEATKTLSTSLASLNQSSSYSSDSSQGHKKLTPNILLEKTPAPPATTTTTTTTSIPLATATTISTTANTTSTTITTVATTTTTTTTTATLTTTTTTTISGSTTNVSEDNSSSSTSAGAAGTAGGVGNNSSIGNVAEDTVSKCSDTSSESQRKNSNNSTVELRGGDKPKTVSRLSERVKKKSWYNVLYPNYKSRSQDFKKLFKDVPNEERLIVDYSCALQREILAQGRLYVSQNYVCFHANIFSWETYLTIKWKDVTSITKEKTALVIPNAISIFTATEKYFFATFTSRDKSFLMLFRVWQNTLMNKQMPPQEMWQWVHNCYGEELGLTTDDEDYIDPSSVPIDTITDIDIELTEESKKNINDTIFINTISKVNTEEKLTEIIKATASNKSDIGGSVKKSKSRSYFFGSSKQSGSDKHSSDTNTETKQIKKSNKASKSKEMKANVKELTLSTAKPDEGIASGGGGSVEIKTSNNSNNNGVNINNAGLKDLTNSTPYEGKRKITKNTRQRDEFAGINIENIPTDISDSSDSDENKIPFVPTTECTSLHEGRQLVHTILPINIETLFSLLFSKSKFLVDFHDHRRTTDTNFPEWITNDEGKQTRTVNLTVQLAASVGPKTSKVTEYQMMRDCSKPGELYSIDVNSENAGIPYADSFCVLMHYCLVRTVDDHTMLSVHAQIKYKKSIWGVVKGFIEKNTWAGLEDHYNALLHALQSETCIPPAKGKGRRPRRGKHKIAGNTNANQNNSSTNTNATNKCSLITNTSTNLGNISTSLSSTATTDNDSINNIIGKEHNHQHNHLHEYHNTHLNHHHHQHHIHKQLELKLNEHDDQYHIALDCYYGTAAQIRSSEDTVSAQSKAESNETHINSSQHHQHPYHTHHYHHQHHQHHYQQNQQQQLLHEQNSTTAKSVHTSTDTRRSKYKWLALFVIMLLCFLIGINGILLHKLWSLEDRIEDEMLHRSHMPNLALLQELPKSQDEWMELFRQQELLHQTELKKWHNVLQTAIELLKKTEKSLAELMFRRNEI